MSMTELYANARKAFESKQVKSSDNSQPKVEDTEEAKNERRLKFKTTQAEFVKHVVQLSENLVKNRDADYSKSFMDVYKFSPPPSRHDSQNVYFQNVLVIELMEGSQTVGYEQFFKDMETSPTLSMLKDALKPFNVFYGYFPRFGGNIVQVRWDDTKPRWALDATEDFDRKKAMSRKNRDKGSFPQNGKRRGFRQHRPSPVVDLFRLLSQTQRVHNSEGNLKNSSRPNDFHRGANFNRSPSPTHQNFRQQPNDRSYRPRDNRNSYPNSRGYRPRDNRNFNTYEKRPYNNYGRNDYSRSGNTHTQHENVESTDYVEVEEVN